MEEDGQRPPRSFIHTEYPFIDTCNHSAMAEQLTIRGTLVGHAGWVTSIATPLDPNSDTVLTSSRQAFSLCPLFSYM